MCRSQSLPAHLPVSPLASLDCLDLRSGLHSTKDLRARGFRMLLKRTPCSVSFLACGSSHGRQEQPRPNETRFCQVSSGLCQPCSVEGKVMVEDANVHPRMRHRLALEIFRGSREGNVDVQAPNVASEAGHLQ